MTIFGGLNRQPLKCVVQSTFGKATQTERVTPPGSIQSPRIPLGKIYVFDCSEESLLFRGLVC